MDDAERMARSGEAGPTPGRGGSAPGLLMAGLLVLVVVFGAGLAVGSGLAGSGPAGSTPGGVAAIPPTPGPSATPRAALTASPLPPSPSMQASPAASPTGAPTPVAVTEPPPATVIPTEPPTSAATLPPEAPADFGLFWQALQLVKEHYVDKDALADQDLTYGAIRGMVDALGDTGHSVFLTPEDLAAEREALEGRLTGIGAFLGERAGRPVIISVISGGPAARAGLRAGDIIEAVDGRSTERLRPEQIADQVRGEAGTQVTLTVLHRGSAEAVEVTVTRERFEVPAATWTIVPGTRVADIRLIQFSARAEEAVTDALRQAIDEGAQGTVLDLRGNPGGLVDEAVGIASQFLREGVVYRRQDASGDTAPVDVRAGGIAYDIPLVVLVDQGSASSAEILAGAIQGNDRGPIIGTQTFGTGTVLNTFELSDGSAVRVGVERWLTPDGELIFEQGITPDEVVELDPEAVPLEPPEIQTLTPEQVAASSDAQLLRALEILAGASAGS